MLLLHLILRVFTHKCAENIVEKYERSLIVWVVQIFTCKQGILFQQQCHF